MKLYTTWYCTNCFYRKFLYFPSGRDTLIFQLSSPVTFFKMLGLWVTKGYSVSPRLLWRPNHYHLKTCMKIPSPVQEEVTHVVHACVRISATKRFGRFVKSYYLFINYLCSWAVSSFNIWHGLSGQWEIKTLTMCCAYLLCGPQYSPTLSPVGARRKSYAVLQCRTGEKVQAFVDCQYILTLYCTRVFQAKIRLRISA